MREKEREFIVSYETAQASQRLAQPKNKIMKSKQRKDLLSKKNIFKYWSLTQLSS